jgi:O-antigen/teichoic acid export membrane protein
MSHTDLLSRSLRAVRWNYLGIGTKVLMQLAAQIVLARMLGPQAFGTIVPAVLIMLFAMLIAEMGMGTAIAQSVDISREDLGAAFILIAAACGVLAGTIFLLRFKFARLVGVPALASALPPLLLMLLVQPAMAVATGLLRLRMDFRAIQLGALGGYFVGFFVVGVSLALAGAGIWALIVAWVTQYAVATLLLCWQARVSLRPAWRFSNRSLPRFGATVTLTNVTNWFIENVDNFVVGRAFGAVALGNYYVAYNLARNPANHMVNSVQNVLFCFTTLSPERDSAVGQAYLATLSAQLLAACPTFFGLAAVSQTVVSALYGEKWQFAASLLTAIALAMPFHTATAIAGSILWGRRQVKRELGAQLLVAALFAAVLWLASHASPPVLAWAVLLVYACRAILLSVLAAASLAIGASDFLRVLRGPLLFGCVAAGMLLGADRVLTAYSAAPGLRLPLLLLIGATSCIAVPVALGPLVVPSVLADILRSRLEHWPSLTRWCLRPCLWRRRGG